MDEIQTPQHYWVTRPLASPDPFRVGVIDKSTDKLCEALKIKQLQDLDKDDLSFVNFVLQRHKYNSFISFLLFRYIA